MNVHYLNLLKLSRAAITLLFILPVVLLFAPTAIANVSSPGGYGLKIYNVNSALYPFVQAYVRTFDHNKQPLINLNAMNIGLMVKGRSYDPMKRQYTIQTIRQRNDAVRSVIILDASMSMSKSAFRATLQV